MQVSDIVSKLNLSKYKVKGNEIEALCPFHVEQRPSFYANIITGLYYCHACGVKGHVDVTQGITFENYSDLLNELEFKTDNTIKFVPEEFNFCELDEHHKKYLLGRGIEEKTIRNFGLCQSKHRRFAYRVVVPITQTAFTARSIINAYPKFLHNTHFSSKNNIFNATFGLFDEVYVTEGVFDAMYLWQNGHPSVAILGCYLSKYHQDVLSCYKRIIFLFDGDETGRKATYDALEKMSGFNVYYSLLSCDPDCIQDFNKIKILKYDKNLMFE